MVYAILWDVVAFEFAVSLNNNSLQSLCFRAYAQKERKLLSFGRVGFA